MPRARQTASSPGTARRAGPAGVTLIEAMAATLIVALLAGSIGAAGETILATLRETERAQLVTELGIGMLDEIRCLPFDDPQLGETAIGPEAGEWTEGGTRALFDDVDDYAVWTSACPLQAKDGTPLTAASYRLGVSIAYVTSSDFSVVSLTPTDTKRIDVSVYEGSDLVETFVTVRVQGGSDVDFDG